MIPWSGPADHLIFLMHDHAWHLGMTAQRSAQGLDLAPDGIAVITLVAMQDHGCGQPVEEGIGGDAVGHLGAGKEECDRAAEVVGEGVDFRGAPATRSADRLREFPPFPPDAQR